MFSTTKNVDYLYKTAAPRFDLNKYIIVEGAKLLTEPVDLGKETFALYDRYEEGDVSERMTKDYRKRGLIEKNQYFKHTKLETSIKASKNKKYNRNILIPFWIYNEEILEKKNEEIFLIKKPRPKIVDKEYRGFTGKRKPIDLDEKSILRTLGVETGNVKVLDFGFRRKFISQWDKLPDGTELSCIGFSWSPHYKRYVVYSEGSSTSFHKGVIAFELAKAEE